MRSRKPLLFIVLTLIVLQAGCSRQSPSQSQKDVNQPVAKEEQAKSSGTHYILGGMTKEQGEIFAKALQKADVDMAPVLKGRELEKQGKWKEAIAHYENM